MITIFLLADSQRDFFDKLYTDYRVPVWRYAMSITHDPDMADDTVQSAFSSLLGKADLLSSMPDRKLKTYVMVTVKHAALRGKEGAARAVPVEDLEIADTETPEELLNRCWMMEEVRTAVGSLDDLDRDILSLRYSAGLRFDDLSKQLGITVSNAKTRKHRAIEKLRRLLAGEGCGHG